jgi:two-component system C4-dicarboxylate transport response regulator DctD
MTEQGGQVFFVDDDQAMRDSAREWLELSGFEVRDFDRAEKALKALVAEFSGVVVSDVKMPGMNGIAFMRAVAQVDPDIPVVLVTAHGDISMAVEAIRDGAYDFIEKPFDPDRILEVVRRALEKRRLVLENRLLKSDLAAAEGLDARLVGSSPAMRALKREIVNIAPTDASVLLVGETGTGKDVAARCLHDLSLRRGRTFMAVNCAAIPTQIAESEFFGHQRGAFTGAQRQRIGRLEAAKGGTLFLDEITSMPLEIQGKMLRALQDKEITPVGSNSPRPVDFRLLSASNHDPMQAIVKGQLREDLYYRLNTVELTIPPLRERREDIPLLFSLFLERAAETFGREVEPPDSRGMAALMAHDWPGNVRELKNMAERYVLSGLAAGERLSRLLAGRQEASLDASLGDHVAWFERQLIAEAIKRHQGNMKAVMADLGLPRRTLNEKMVKFGLSRSNGLKP